MFCGIPAARGEADVHVAELAAKLVGALGASDDGHCDQLVQEGARAA